MVDGITPIMIVCQGLIVDALRQQVHISHLLKLFPELTFSMFFVYFYHFSNSQDKRLL